MEISPFHIIGGEYLNDCALWDLYSCNLAIQAGNMSCAAGEGEDLYIPP